MKYLSSSWNNDKYLVELYIFGARLVEFLKELMEMRGEGQPLTISWEEVRARREKAKNKNVSRKDIELKIEQLADQMEMTNNEGEKEEIYAEIERLSMKLDKMK